MNLKKILTEAGRKALLPIGLVGLIGCATMSPAERDTLSFFSAMAPYNPNLNAGEQAAWAGAGAVAQSQNARDNASRMGTNVNVYGEIPKAESVSLKKDSEYKLDPGIDHSEIDGNINLEKIARISRDLDGELIYHLKTPINVNLQKETKGNYFTCNFVQDFNENGRYEYPEEFVGIKNKFRVGEDITFVISDDRLGKEGTLNFTLYNGSGEEVLKKFFDKDPSTRMMAQTIGTNGDSVRGTYKAVWKFRGEYFGSTEFEIIGE